MIKEQSENPSEGFYPGGYTSGESDDWKKSEDKMPSDLDRESAEDKKAWLNELYEKRIILYKRILNTVGGLIKEEDKLKQLKREYNSIRRKAPTSDWERRIQVIYRLLKINLLNPEGERIKNLQRINKVREIDRNRRAALIDQQHLDSLIDQFLEIGEMIRKIELELGIINPEKEKQTLIKDS